LAGCADLGARFFFSALLSTDLAFVFLHAEIPKILPGTTQIAASVAWSLVSLESRTHVHSTYQVREAEKKKKEITIMKKRAFASALKAGLD
jgi:hypothetical protein